MKAELSKVIIVAGPTSSGKSDFAVALAKKCNGEVVSADSRQVYRYLNIGTGKITEEEMQRVPHHMIDICDIDESFSVVEYERRALPIVYDILARGKTPIICGGTGYYIDALMYENTVPKEKGHSSTVSSFDALSTEELYTLLEKRDRRRALTIDKHNRVRLIRALELIEKYGKVPELGDKKSRFTLEFYLLNPPKEVLEERVHTRLLRRLKQGMIEEMQSLIAKGYKAEVLASRGIEYKWMAKYLDKTISYDELIERLRIATWQYAKRQRTWNKKYEAFAKVITN